MDKDKFINSCVKEMEGNTLAKSINSKNYCDCMIEKIAERFNYKEIEYIFLDNSIPPHDSLFYEKLRKFYNSPNVYEISKDCINSNILNGNNHIEITSEEQKKALIRQLKDNLKMDPDYNELQKLIDVDGYCDCYVVELYKSFTWNQILNNALSKQELEKIQEKCTLLNVK